MKIRFVYSYKFKRLMDKKVLLRNKRKISPSDKRIGHWLDCDDLLSPSELLLPRRLAKDIHSTWVRKGLILTQSLDFIASIMAAVESATGPIAGRAAEV